MHDQEGRDELLGGFTHLNDQTSIHRSGNDTFEGCVYATRGRLALVNGMQLTGPGRLIQPTGSSRLDLAKWILDWIQRTVFTAPSDLLDADATGRDERHAAKAAELVGLASQPAIDVLCRKRAPMKRSGSVANGNMPSGLAAYWNYEPKQSEKIGDAL
mgnify:CR=1 FL=1